MFAGTTAQDGATKIKQKMGVDDLRVKYIEIHEDRIEITVQDPAKPKNFDEYTYDGTVKGPKPVEALVLGNQEFTADKSRLFSLNDINLGAVPEALRDAMARAQIEDGKPDLISIDWQSASLRLTKEEKEKQQQARQEKFMEQARSGKGNAMDLVRDPTHDLAVTWRIYIRGPHMSKDLWADEKGKIFEPTW
jgi:hypothetical protein